MDEPLDIAALDLAGAADLASRLKTYGEPPRICGDAAAVMLALIARVEALEAALRDILSMGSDGRDLDAARRAAYAALASPENV